MNFNTIPTDILFKILKYLDFKSIHYLSLTNKTISNQNILRIIIIPLLLYRFGINNEEDYIYLRKCIQEKNYTFSEYLYDIYQSIYKISIEANKPYIYKYYNYNYHNINNLRTILSTESNKNKIINYFYNKNIIKKYKSHYIYRIPPPIYWRIKKNYYLLSLIY